MVQRSETVLVVDFGAQYAQLIARRVRELHVYSEIVPHRITAAELAADPPAALILSGGPKSVHVDGAPSLDPAIYELGIPTFGICYGTQLIAQQLGGVPVAEDTRDPQLRRLRNVVEEMSIASGVPVPKIYMLEQEAAINAFAAGYSTSDAVVAVTRGAVSESRPRLGGTPATKTVKAGRVLAFGPDHIHRMGGAVDGSVSIHAYSPPLWRMGQYAISDSGVMRRFSVSYADELRPI